MIPGLYTLQGCQMVKRKRIYHPEYKSSDIVKKTTKSDSWEKENWRRRAPGYRRDSYGF